LYAEFTTDDVEPLCMLTPNEPRAWGAAMMRAARDGIIERTGRTRQSNSRVCHARDKRVWKSKICRAPETLFPELAQNTNTANEANMKEAEPSCKITLDRKELSHGVFINVSVLIDGERAAEVFQANNHLSNDREINQPIVQLEANLWRELLNGTTVENATVAYSALGKAIQIAQKEDARGRRSQPHLTKKPRA